MSKTREERLAYVRGYNRIKDRHWRQVSKLLKIARGYRLAAAAHDRRCAACIHWTRGCATCHWGYCDGNFEWRADGMVHPDENRVRMTTGDDFYCANWRPA